MAHAHLLVQHVLKQVEQHLANRDKRDARPAWLVNLVERAADWFEPLSGVGRVGYDCQPTDDGWEVRLYLGSTELVGGREDGQWRNSSFELDLSGLTACFSRIEEFRWNVAGGEFAGSFLTIRGCVDEFPVCLKAYSRAPQNLGPALRQYYDGRIQPVE